MIVVEQGLDYEAARGDEVEDLAALLAEAQRRFPRLQGVCSGAIASDYQRLRIESVRCPSATGRAHPLAHGRACLGGAGGGAVAQLTGASRARLPRYARPSEAEQADALPCTSGIRC